MTTITVSQIYKILNGSYSIKDFVKDDKLIMNRMTKSALFLYFCSETFFQIPDTLW